MYAPSSTLTDQNDLPVGVWAIMKGRELLTVRKGRSRVGKVTKLGTVVEACAVTLLTVSGRRLSCAGDQLVAVRGGAGRRLWRKARAIRLSDVLFTTSDGILGLDRVSCIVQSTKPGEPWITVKTENGTLFAEEILCRAT